MRVVSTLVLSAVTGDLTVAVGFGDGDDVANKGTTANGNASTQVDGEVVKAGVKYVTGDMTLQLGVVSGTGKR